MKKYVTEIIIIIIIVFLSGCKLNQKYHESACCGDDTVIVSMPIQKNNSLFNISQDSVNLKFFQVFEKNKIDYKKIRGDKCIMLYSIIDIKMDTLGDILDMSFYFHDIYNQDTITTNLMKEGYRKVLRELSPLNPFYYPEYRDYDDYAYIEIMFNGDSGIIVEVGQNFRKK